MVMLSRLVALSVSLTRRVSLLQCQNGWDDQPVSSGGDPSHCSHYDSGHTAVVGSVEGQMSTATTGTQTLEDFAPGGCENPYGGQICRCTSTGDCAVETSYPFSWVDLTVHGTQITDWEQNADDGWYHINLPFFINWYGTQESTVTVGTNGLLSFGNSHLANGASEPIPCVWDGSADGGCLGTHYCSDCADNSAAGVGIGHGVDGVIAVFWCDLDTSAASGSVFYHITDMTDVVSRGPAWSKLLVEWVDVRVFTRAGQRYLNGEWVDAGATVPAGNTFEVVLFGDGAILMQYLAMDPVHHSWSTESIGFEDQSGQHGVQISYGNIPHPGTAYFVPASCHVYHTMSGHSGDVHATASEYRFDGNTDDVAGANHGTVTGNAVFVRDRFGVPDSAIQLDGSSFVEIAAPFPHVNNVFAISIWLKPEYPGSTSPQYSILGYQAPGDGAFGDGCCCPLRSPSLWVGEALAAQRNARDLIYDSCALGSRGSNGQYAGGAKAQAALLDDESFFSVGEYVHVVWVKDLTQHSRYAHEYRFYKNGEPVSTTEAPDSVILSPRYLIGAVAAQDPLQGFVGTIDDVRFYDRALSDAEVATLFHDTSTPPDQG